MNTERCVQSGQHGLLLSAGIYHEHEAPSLATLAEELQQIDPLLTIEQARAITERQVQIAGVPANGPGMAADHEWTEQQMAMLQAAGAFCDGLTCYVATPQMLYERGLLTTDELPQAISRVVHRSPCTMVQRLVAR